MTVRLTPGSSTAGGTRVFQVLRATHDTGKRQLTVAGRDGFVCLEIVGPWEIEFSPSNVMAMGIDEIERIHDGRSLVLMN